MLEQCIESLVTSKVQSSKRLDFLADYVKRLLEDEGLPDVVGGTGGELRVPGLIRNKDWDVAYEFAGKFRLLISLKSLLKNLSGSIPNRIDDLQGELANIQQVRPEIVIGYVVLVDIKDDKSRVQDSKSWVDYFEEALQKLAIRKPPLWNQGLLEAVWFIRFDSRLGPGTRVVDPVGTEERGRLFIRRLLEELHRREPAVPFTSTSD